MFLAIKATIFAVVLLSAGGGILYVKNLQSSIDTLKDNNLKLEQSLEVQKKVIEQQAKDSKDIVAAHKKQIRMNEKLNKSIQSLRDRFHKINASGKKRDIGEIAKNKPMLMQKVINKGTKNSFRCMEIAMGSELTEAEKNAKSKSKINPECSDIANPSYVKY